MRPFAVGSAQQSLAAGEFLEGLILPVLLSSSSADAVDLTQKLLGGKALLVLSHKWPQIIKMIPSDFKKPCEWKWEGDEWCLVVVCPLSFIPQCLLLCCLVEVIKLIWKTKQGKIVWGSEHGREDEVLIQTCYVLMCLCCSCPSLRQHPWAATSECWPCLWPCCCPAAGWQSSVVLLATPMGCTPWLSWQQRWDCFHMVLFLLCFSILSWGCVTFFGSWWICLLFPQRSSSVRASLQC